MNASSVPDHTPRWRRLSRIVVMCAASLAVAACTAAKGDAAPAELAAVQPASAGRPSEHTAPPAPAPAAPPAPAPAAPPAPAPAAPPAPAPAALATAGPAIPPVEDVPAERIEALAARDELRAFNGAPPVIPHEIEQRSSTDCLRCHGNTPEADDKGAPKVPHVFMASCTQCHVEAESEDLFGEALAPNSFDGIPAPRGGSRAYVGAPPLVPHSTLMRSNCLSCHGPFGLPALKTSHPERRSCLQCHGVSATMNQRMPWS